MNSSYYKNYGTNNLNNTINSATNAAIWMGIALILAIVGGIVLYFTFLSKKNEGKFTGFLAWIHDFLSFKKMFAEVLLRIGYLITAIYVTLSSFSLIGSNFLGFLMNLVLGNILVRIIFEFLLIALVICRNTTEINKKLSKEIDSKNDENK